jgi:hypothetical protein
MVKYEPAIPPVVVPLRLIERVAVPSATKRLEAPALVERLAEPSRKLLAPVITLTAVAAEGRKNV